MDIQGVICNNSKVSCVNLCDFVCLMRPSTSDLEDAVPLADLSALLSARPSYETLRRWAVDGAKSKSGKMVKLRTVQLTNGRGSSVKLFQEFLVRVQS